MPQPQIIDGLTLKSNIRFLPYRAPALFAGDLEVLRKSSAYVSKWHCVPDSFNEPILPKSHAYYQVWVPPGSYLWAYCFNNKGTGNRLLSFQIKEACNDIGLFKELIPSTGAVVNATGTVQNPVMLTVPRPLMEPGLLDIDIANAGTEATTCQLLLMFAIPAELFGRYEGDGHNNA